MAHYKDAMEHKIEVSERVPMHAADYRDLLAKYIRFVVQHQGTEQPLTIERYFTPEELEVIRQCSEPRQ